MLLSGDLNWALHVSYTGRQSPIRTCSVLLGEGAFQYGTKCRVFQGYELKSFHLRWKHHCSFGDVDTPKQGVETARIVASIKRCLAIAGVKSQALNIGFTRRGVLIGLQFWDIFLGVWGGLDLWWWSWPIALCHPCCSCHCHQIYLALTFSVFSERPCRLVFALACTCTLCLFSNPQATRTFTSCWVIFHLFYFSNFFFGVLFLMSPEIGKKLVCYCCAPLEK